MAFSAWWIASSPCTCRSGGDPLVRHRELETWSRVIGFGGIHVQIVTSAFRPLAPAWAILPRLNVVVSMTDSAGARRAPAPATYNRI